MKGILTLLLMAISFIGYGQCVTPTVHQLYHTGTGEIYRPNLSAVAAGDTIKVMETNYSVIEFYGPTNGTESCPIIVVANTSFYTAVMRFKGNVGHIKILSTGAGTDTTTFRSIEIGILALSYAHHITNEGAKIGGIGAGNGIYCKVDVDVSYSNPMTWSSNYRMTGNKFIGLWIHDTVGEGVYCGDTDSGGNTVVSTWSGLDTLIYPVFVDSTVFAYCRIERCGWDGLQLSSARNGNLIHHNIIRNVGLLNEPSQQAGIIVGGNSKADVYYNTVENSAGNALEFFGYGAMACYGNTLKNSLEATIFANSYGTSTLADPLQQLNIYNNYIVNPPLDGAVRLYNDFRGHAGHNIHDNTFCIPDANPVTWQGTYFTIYTPPSSTTTSNILACESLPLPVIDSVLPVNTTIKKFGKFEAIVKVTAGYDNPYDFDSINVYAIVTSPSNLKDTVDAFWMQDYYNPDTTNHNLVSINDPSFRLRYSPKETGSYSYQVFVKDTVGTTIGSVYNFTSISTTEKGFIRKNATNYLSHDDGTAFMPIGQNLAYSTGYLYPDYNTWIDSMVLYNQNFARVWGSLIFGFGNEWKNGVSNSFASFQGLMKYEQKRSWALDWLVNKAEKKGMYLQLTQLVHNEVMTGGSGFWADNPYNSANGGPCDSTIDFFRNTTAIKAFKNKLRYNIARYGYSKNIMAWDLANEINNTDEYYGSNKDSVRKAVRLWTDTIAQFIKKKDPNKHLVMTSNGGYGYNGLDGMTDQDSLTLSLPSLDVNVYHWYNESPAPQNLLSTVTKKYLNDFSKPVKADEVGFSLYEPNDINTLDSTGVQLHNTIWGSAFSGSFSPAVYWQWGNYVAEEKLNYHYKYLPTALSSFDLKSGNFKPVASTTSGGSTFSDVVINPLGGGWSLPVNDTLFSITSAGEMSPGAGRLGIILYGDVNNTSYKAAPRFNVTYLANGNFVVKILDVAPVGGNITVYVDNMIVLNVSATANTTYTVSVNAGAHSIKLDNKGTDWLVLDEISFTNAAVAARSYSLKSTDNTKVVGYILNQNYNYSYLNSTGNPSAITGASLSVPVSNGNYSIAFKNTLTNTTVATSAVTVSGGVFSVAIPSLHWDMYYTIQPVSITPARENILMMRVRN